MANRLTDNEKWKKIWFRKLTPVEKCFWNYLTDSCNVAGIWEVDFETAAFFIGSELNINEIKQTFQKQFIEFDNSRRWYIIDYIEFQCKCTIGQLNPKNKFHLSVLNLIQKYDIIGVIEGASKGLQSPYIGDKRKDIYKEKEEDKENAPEIEEPEKLKKIKEYFTNKGYPVEEGIAFYNHYEAQGWVTGSGLPITNWRLKSENWHKEQLNRNYDNKNNSSGQLKNNISHSELLALINDKPKEEKLRIQDLYEAAGKGTFRLKNGK
jgi:hypothetical protein